MHTLAHEFFELYFFLKADEYMYGSAEPRGDCDQINVSTKLHGSPQMTNLANGEGSFDVGIAQARPHSLSCFHHELRTDGSMWKA